MTGRWALLAASCVLAVVMSAMVLAVATYEGRAARDRARGPVIAETARDAVAWWASRFDAVGGLQHSVVFVEPLDASAPPPPGLTRWPAPGEAMLSPELLRRGATEEVRTRYGRFGGLIGPEGLLSPSERLAYVRPPTSPNAVERESWLPITGFGRPFPLVETLDQRDLSEVLLALGTFTLVPALALMTVAARRAPRTGNRTGPRWRPRTRSRRSERAGPRWRRALTGLGEEVPPLVIGSVAGGLVLVLAACVDLPVPTTGYVLNSADVRAAWPLGCAAILTSLTTGLVLVAAPRRTEQKTSKVEADHETAQKGDREAERGPGAPPYSVPKRRLVACALAAGTVALSQYFPPAGKLIAFAVGTAGMWALLPSAATALTVSGGRELARRGADSGRPGLLTGGLRLAARPAPFVRLFTALVVLLGVLTLIQIWEGRIGDTARAALTTERRIGDTLLVVRTAGHPDLERFSRALPRTSALAVLTIGEDGRLATLVGPCRTLRMLKLPCAGALVPGNHEDDRLKELRSWYGIRTLTGQVGRGRTERTRNLVVVVSDTRGQYPRVARAAYATLPVLETTAPGGGWIDGAVRRTGLGTWLTLLGLVGVFALLQAAWIGFAEDRDASGPAAWWHLTVPLLAMTALVIVITAWHGLFLVSITAGGTLPWPVLTTTAAACALLAIALGLFHQRTRPWIQMRSSKAALHAAMAGSKAACFRKAIRHLLRTVKTPRSQSPGT
ncbi:hypothetical protein [Streptosporangium sp. NPDC049376]|uniref:hypothetical protein n=1 Tax=Streptosporangium sp. NPDC049376 TaxID=3366192 RepID=UPI0037B4E325